MAMANPAGVILCDSADIKLVLPKLGTSQQAEPAHNRQGVRSGFALEIGKAGAAPLLAGDLELVSAHLRRSFGILQSPREECRDSSLAILPLHCSTVSRAFLELRIPREKALENLAPAGTSVVRARLRVGPV